MSGAIRDQRQTALLIRADLFFRRDAGRKVVIEEKVLRRWPIERRRRDSHATPRLWRPVRRPSARGHEQAALVHVFQAGEARLGAFSPRAIVPNLKIGVSVSVAP